MKAINEQEKWVDTGRWVAWNKDTHEIEADNFATMHSCFTWIDKRFPEDANGVQANVRPEWMDC